MRDPYTPTSTLYTFHVAYPGFRVYARNDVGVYVGVLMVVNVEGRMDVCGCIQKITNPYPHLLPRTHPRTLPHTHQRLSSRTPMRDPLRWGIHMHPHQHLTLYHVVSLDSASTRGMTWVFTWVYTWVYTWKGEDTFVNTH